MVVVVVRVREGGGGRRAEVVLGNLLALHQGHAEVLSHVLQHLHGRHALGVRVGVGVGMGVGVGEGGSGVGRE